MLRVPSGGSRIAVGFHRAPEAVAVGQAPYGVGRDELGGAHMVDQFIVVSSSGFALGVQGATASPVAFPPGLFRGAGRSDLNWRANALFPDCPDGDFPNVATLPSATGVAVLGTGEGEGRNPLITLAPKG